MIETTTETTAHAHNTTPITPGDDTLVVALRRPVPRAPVACSECGEPATIEWRDAVAGPDGPIEHVEIVCTDRHWFLMPAALLKPAS